MKDNTIAICIQYLDCESAATGVAYADGQTDRRLQVTACKHNIYKASRDNP